jgi:LCP family protein required for cell wall assembly
MADIPFDGGTAGFPAIPWRRAAERRGAPYAGLARRQRRHQTPTKRLPPQGPPGAPRQARRYAACATPAAAKLDWPAGPSSSSTVAAALPSTGTTADLPRTTTPTEVPAPTAEKRRRFLRRPRSKLLTALIAVPLALMLVAGAVAIPLLYQTLQAGREVFVEPVQRQRSSLVPVLNTAGTPVLEAAPTQFAEQGWNGKDRMTILLLGVDNPVEGAARTDTIILVNIDPQANSAAMMPIPRDTRVVIPGYGIDKINAAYALGEFNKVPGGGVGLVMRTIEANFGIPVHHFASVDFTGFVKMVDTLGGITLDVPYPIKDNEYPGENLTYQRIYFPAGWQRLNGTKALQYARTRHADGDSHRSRRQQQVLLAIRDQAIALDLLPKLPSLIDDFGDTVRTDVSPDDALRLARIGSRIPRDQIVSHSLLPALYEQRDADKPYYLVPDWDLAAPILTEFTGAKVNPPGAALTNPSYDLPVLIENGTTNDGLAGRVADMMIANGFTDVEVVMAAEPGKHPATTVTDRGGNLGTSALITNLVGVGADKITVVDAPWTDDDSDESQPAASPIGDGTGATTGTILTEEASLSAEERKQYAIVITLGDDAPDPAASDLQLDEYQEQIGDSDNPADEDTDSAP